MATGLPATLTIFDRVNAEGGVNGRPIEVIGTHDTGASAETAAVSARSVINDEPDLIILFAGDNYIATMVPLIKQAGIPTLSTQLTDELAYPADHNVWGFMPGSQQLSQFALHTATEILGDLEGARVAYEYVAEASSAESVSDLTRSVLEDAGAQTVDVQALSYTATTFASQAAKIAKLDPDLYVVSDATTSVELIVDALRTAGWDGPVLLSGDSANSDLDLAAIADDNYFAPRAFNAPTRGSEMAELADEYGHDFTGGYFAHGWSQGEVAVAALTACGSECTPEALLEALGDIGEFTPTASATAGPMRFSPESRIAVTTVQLNR